MIRSKSQFDCWNLKNNWSSEFGVERKKKKKKFPSKVWIENRNWKGNWSILFFEMKKFLFYHLKFVFSLWNFDRKNEQKICKKTSNELKRLFKNSKKNWNWNETMGKIISKTN